MTDYSIAQIPYTGPKDCLSAYPEDYPNIQPSGKLYPINIPGSQDPTGDFSSYGRAPYQQIVLNKYYFPEGTDSQKIPTPSDVTFNNNTPYYLRLKLPRNNNYDLDFALLLIPEFGEYNDLDQLEYQFIRYIHVPKSNLKGLGQSTVVLYEEPKISEDNNSFYYDDTNVKVAIAEPKEDENGNEKNAISSYVGKMFYGSESPVTYYTVEKQGNKYVWVKAGKNYNGGFAPIGKTTSIMVHSWITADTEDTCTYEIIFKPRRHSSSNPLKYLYLYLIPNSWDNDIMWLDNQNAGNGSNYTQYYGRHIDLNNVECELFAIKNLLGDRQPRRMGIWGHSELLFTINGEELRVGPSGYYEVQDFDINYLGVVARSHADQFTIDVQYPI